MKELTLRSVKKGVDLLKCIFMILLVTVGSIKAQEDLYVIRNEWLKFSDAPNSLYHHLTGQAYELLESREELGNHLPEVIKSAKKLSGYKEPSGTEEPVFTGRYQRDDYVVEKYFVKGEGDYNPAFVPSVVPGALQSYDLPDLAASLAPRKLLMAGVKDGLGSPAHPEGIAGDLDIIKAGYQYKDAFDQLDVTFRFGESFEKPFNPYDLYRQWIK